MKKELWIKALCVLTLIWGIAWAISSLASSKKATPERFLQIYEQSALVTSQDKDTEERKAALRNLAEVMNRMDFRAREGLRGEGEDRRFFESLSPDERRLWIELTIEKSMTKMMQAIDAMPAEQRKEFIEKGIAELEKGQAKADMDRLREMDPELIERISQQGMQAYYQEAGSETKMDLAPLMDAMNGVMQGIRGNPHDPSNR